MPKQSTYNYYKLSHKRRRWQLKVSLYMIAIAFICGVIFGIEQGARAVVQADTITITKTVEPTRQSLGVSVVTMYTSRPEETDGTPCIGANGQDQCVLWSKGQNICATNWADLGSVLEVEGLGECLVLDRMNSRYNTEVDWYNGYNDDCLDGYDQYDICPQLKEALAFGSQKKEIKLIK